MKQKILATITILIVSSMLFCSNVFAERIMGEPLTTTVIVYLDVKGEKLDYFVNVLFKSDNGEEINCLIDKNQNWQRSVELSTNTTYTITTDFGNGQGDFADYHFIFSDGNTTGKITPTIETTSITLTFAKVGDEKTALEKPDYKAEGTRLLTEYNEAMKPIEATKEWQDHCEEFCNVNIEKYNHSANRMLNRFLEFDNSNTEEMWFAKTPMERWKYDNFVLSQKVALVTNPKSLLETRKDYIEYYAKLSSSGGYYQPFYNQGKASEEVNAMVKAAIDAEKAIYAYLYDVYHTEHVFVNIYDLESTVPVATEPEKQTEKLVTSNNETNVSSISMTDTITKNDIPPKAENGFVKFLKNNWFTLMLVVVAGIAFLVVRHIRKTKSVDNN